MKPSRNARRQARELKHQLQDVADLAEAADKGLVALQNLSDLDRELGLLTETLNGDQK